MVRIAVVENMEKTHLGTLGRALDEAGADVELFRPWQDGTLPSGIHDHDGLIVLGGKQSAVDDAAYPYLPALAGVMRRFGDADKAVLGICLGGQLLARAYGGENILGSAKEFAWTPLDVTPEGAADPLFHGLCPGSRASTGMSTRSPCPTRPCGWCPARPSPTNAFASAAPPTACSSTSRPASRSSKPGWRFPDVAERMAPGGWLDRYPEIAARHAAAADRAGHAIARAFLQTVQPARAAAAAD